MKQTCGVGHLREVCRRENTQRLLEKYIRCCRRPEESEAGSSQKRGSPSDRFPNLAGFCRFLGVTPEDLEDLAKEFPREIHGIYAALEDEALNSSLPAAILSVYLKKRLGYEYERSSEEAPPDALQILFAHDVLQDGG